MEDSPSFWSLISNFHMLKAQSQIFLRMFIIFVHTKVLWLTTLPLLPLLPRGVPSVLESKSNPLTETWTMPGAPLIRSLNAADLKTKAPGRPGIIVHAVRMCVSVCTVQYVHV